jgi:3-oxoacyl-[acyl-carrier protein] reductase
MGRLAGRVAIVTGAGGGIGREHALLFAQEGARVVVNDIGLRDGSDPTTVVQEIEDSGGHALANSASATWAGAGEIVQAALDHFGRVDILVNNAAVAAHGDFWEFTEEDWDRTLDVNLKGYFAMMKAVVPHMARQGSGAIVNTSSAAGFGDPGHAVYGAAKEGVVGLSRTAAMELGRFGIRVNVVRPASVSAAYESYVRDAERFRRLTEYATGRSLIHGITPEEFSPARIAPFVVWLCTDAARNVNGRSFSVAGPVVARLTDPQREVRIKREGGWTLDALDLEAPNTIAKDLSNPWTLDDHPELKVFSD